MEKFTTGQEGRQNQVRQSNTPQAPVPGTALTAFLRRHVADLRSFDPDHSNRMVQQMIDCADFLMIEGERLGRGQRG